MHATVEQYMWFSDLAQRAYECARCPRMKRQSAVMGPLNGRIEARVVIVGEAPGRFGSATTRVPFHGDRSGENFEALLPHAGLRREDTFITNAAMCNPTDDLGRNARPRASEVRSCSDYLREVLDLIQPLYVVTLGQKALDALGFIERHQVVLKEMVGEVVAWRGVKVVPLYHPGARAMVRRPFRQQLRDYQALGTILRADPLAMWTNDERPLVEGTP